MMATIDAAKLEGDTLGGTFEVMARGVPVGLGSYVQWDRKLDGRLAQAVMSIPAIKAVAIGEGVAGAHRPGSQVHDEIVADLDAANCG
jgi:chorismate synthase